eukprot:CCRYP_003325-RB/>CCRYP_003325-RB protein AED:0.06 eAED:0.06 QI:85/1/1/1/0.87/0.77/9/930/1539
MLKKCMYRNRRLDDTTSHRDVHNSSIITMMELSYENEDKTLLRQFVERGYRTAPLLHINGQPVPPSLAAQARPNQTLLSYLRSTLGLTGTKLGCGEGGCGACTVVLSAYCPRRNTLLHQSVNACLFPVLACDGKMITTVEGVGSWKKLDVHHSSASAREKDDNLHPIQRAMVDMHGSQCGFCTPGIIMAMYGLFATEDGEGPSRVSHLEEHLDGNLCRCTGYRPIWDAARSLCVDEGMGVVRGPCGVPCRECPEREVCEMECNVREREGVGSMDVVHSCTQRKVVEFRKVVDEKHGSDWWKQPMDMFPKELLPTTENTEIREQLSKPLVVVDSSIHNGGTWLQPHTLEELLDLFRDYAPAEKGGIKMVVGNTEVGIETKFKHAVYNRLVHPKESIHSLYEVLETESHFHVGACSSLSALQQFCHRVLHTNLATDVQNDTALHKKRTAKPIHDMLRWFASTQIRNVACLGGNLATASPISDMNPLLASMNAQIVLASRPVSDGGIERRKIAVKDFFTGYRTVDKKDIEVIERVDIPMVSEFEYVAPFKQARRREDDISIVTSGMRMRLSPSEHSWVIADVAIAFGGMAPKTVLANKTMAAMLGKAFEESTFAEARAVLQHEFRMPDDVPGGQAEYRLTLACSFLYKFYLHCAAELKKDVEASASKDNFPAVPAIPSDEESAIGGFVSAPKPSIRGAQSFPAPKVATGLEATHLAASNAESAKVLASPKEPSKLDSVGQPATHASGPLHCTGEAAYTDDIPAPENLLHGSLILASKCHAPLASIDITPALSIPGVFGAYTHQDIEKLGGDNRMGPILLDDVAFLPVGEKVEFVGQVLGIVVGASQEIAEKGARAVVVEYGEEEAGNAIVSIEDAIKAGSFWTDFRHEMKRGGDVYHILSQTEVDGKPLVVVEGSIRSGGQEHFYLEPNSTLAIPSESGTNLTIYASTQAPTKTQDFCARVTNTPAARVVVRMKRMGGGFGGKETRSVFSSVAAAVAAKCSNRPVRLTLNRDTDMSITGGRHAFVTYYRAGAVVNDDGTVKLHALDVKLYNNGGCKFDLTGPVMDRALFHVDNCYNWPNFHSVGTPCKTSQPPHTAFRGFGGPQGMVITEHIMDHFAIKCNVSGDKLRRDNMYTLQDCTPFGMRFGDNFTGKWNVPSMYDQLYNTLDVPGRRAAIAAFNAKNKWTKRGIALIPTKFGIAFTAKYMNQGGALVHLYTDGTVLVSHGGTEMGQGLHTKVCQVAAQAFGIPLDDVYVNDSSTDKVANTIPSAASMSTDLNGMATLDACRKILERIQPIRDQLPPNAKLSEVAKKAFYERVDLSAHGFYALDNDRCGYDWNKDRPEDFPVDLPENSWKGHPFNYFTQGVALAEVEIDVLTGDHKTLSADVIVDVGSSINPAIDIGQIEGAFIQGMGWSTIEEVVYADDDHTWIRPRARVFTTGPGTYKIPCFNDVPERFNVSLLENADNPFAVHSSKAVGEPPFFLGCSVFFAIKDAVTAARGENSGYFEFRMPATSERIRMACGDVISSECIATEFSTFQPKGSF